MAVLEEARSAGIPGEPTAGPSAPGRPSRLNILTGLLGGVAGYALGHLFGNWAASSWTSVSNSGDNNIAITLGYVCGTIGFIAGIGALNYPLGKLIGRT